MTSTSTRRFVIQRNWSTARGLFDNLNSPPHPLRFPGWHLEGAPISSLHQLYYRRCSQAAWCRGHGPQKAVSGSRNQALAASTGKNCAQTFLLELATRKFLTTKTCFTASKSQQHDKRSTGNAFTKWWWWVYQGSNSTNRAACDIGGTRSELWDS